MSNQAFRTLQQHLMKLYDEKAYAQVLDLVEKEQAKFPDDALALFYWRICMRAVLGNQEEALRIFREALDLGYWYSDKWLARDPDLASLRPLPAFEEMVEICRQRRAEAQANTRPELRVQRPVEQATALPLLIGLHGNGGNASSTLESWSRITEQGWLLAIPQSSQISEPNAFVWDDRATGISEVREHLAALNSEYAIDPERVVLGGFSMGGGQAVWMALHQSIKTRGFVVLGPYLTEAELESLPALLAERKPAGLRGFIVNGEKDVECLAVSRKVAEIMHDHGLTCELVIVPDLTHVYPPDFAERAAKGLAFVEQA